MAKRQLVLTATDDGCTLDLKIEEYETIGSSQVGPTLLFRSTLLSFCQQPVEDWRRDVAVIFAEHL